ncbi:MAG: pyridoxamine 5'-phosphate oxidase family protein [Verrucomicrobiales bacterium]
MATMEAEKFCELLGKFSTAVLVTHAGMNKLRARPMAISQVEANGDLWFVTGAETAKAHEIESNTSVQIICQEDRSACISISGHAELVRDQAKLDEIWKPEYKVWFPRGKEDPNIRLIFVKGEEAEYWDNSGAEGLKYAFKALAALATGTRPNADDSKIHGKVKLTTI